MNTEKYAPHWADTLQAGDRCIATIRHDADGSKNIHDANVIVVRNFPANREIQATYNADEIFIPYNELIKRYPIPQHTPRPWKVDTDFSCHDAEKNYYSIVGGKGYYDKDKNVGFNITAFISMNDARLIARAPELKAENEELKESLQRICNVKGPVGSRDWEAVADEIGIIAREALNKVKGGNS